MSKKFFGFEIPISGMMFTEVEAETEEEARELLAKGLYDALDEDIFDENVQAATVSHVFDENGEEVPW